MRPWAGLDNNVNIFALKVKLMQYYSRYPSYERKHCWTNQQTQNNGGFTVLGYFHSAIYDILLVTVIWEQLVILQYYCLQIIISYTTFALLLSCFHKYNH